MGTGGVDIASTVRCPNLPIHIQASVHDVASTFKRFLSVLPGGILGSLSVFDALVAIHSQLRGDPEFPRTKQTKVRSRLIALAIGTIRSQFRRELVCAVFGLLSFIGRVAETTPREDESGRPLPTSDLMGYGALGIVFGPLLVGDLLDKYTMKLAAPDSGLLLFPLTPQKLLHGRRKPKEVGNGSDGSSSVNKILITNGITEMLIANWRDIVRQMRSLGVNHRKDASFATIQGGSLRAAPSEDFVVEKPRVWSSAEFKGMDDSLDRGASPEIETPTIGVRRQRPKSQKSWSSNRVRGRPSINALSPTAEESLADDQPLTFETSPDQSEMKAMEGWTPAQRELGPQKIVEWNAKQSPTSKRGRRALGSPQVSLDEVPPRTSSKSRQYHDSSEGKRSYASPAPEKEPRAQLTNELVLGGSPRGRNATKSSWGSPHPRHVGKHSSPSGTRQSDRSRKVSRTSATAPRQSSRSSRNDFESVHEIAENNMKRPSADVVSLVSNISGELSSLANNLTVLDQELQPESGLENVQPSSGIPKSESRAEAVASPAEELSEYFQLSPDGPPQRRYKPKGSEVLEQDSQVTSTNFYAAMKIPPYLTTSQAQEPLARPLARASSWKISPRQSESWVGRLQPWDSEGRKSQTIARDGPTIRPSVSEVASKQGAVRAMAAMFDHDSPQKSPSSPYRTRSSRQSISLQNMYGSPVKSIRSSKSGPAWTPQSTQKQSLSSPDRTPRKSFDTAANRLDDAARQRIRTSVGDSVALKAAAFEEAGKQQQGGTVKRPLLAKLKPPIPWEKEEPEMKAANYNEESQKILPGLGSMVPHAEQPPVAQHLNLPRPTSTTPTVMSNQESKGAVDEIGLTSVQRPRSTTGLHSRIRDLQRQLDFKNEEVIQLKRQLEAQGDSDIGTLSEQLREAKRESHMWKERAEAAERRVKVFEKFTGRLKGIREAAAVADQRMSTLASDYEPSSENQSGKSDSPDGNHRHVVKGRRVLGRSTVVDTSEDSGKTEDAGVVSARIRKCLHGKSAHDTLDGALGSFNGTPEKATNLQNENGNSFSTCAADFWQAAEELLQMEEAGEF